MALNTQLSDAAANAGCNAIMALLSGGSIKIYTGTQPATGNTSLSGNTLLATLPMNTPAFGSAVAGVAALNPSGVSASAVASGTATWARVCNSSGTGILDVTVGVSGCNINLNSTVISSGGTVTISSLSFSELEAGL